MRQVWLTRRGGLDVFEVRESPDPEPEPGEVRVRVRASGVNFADVLIRIGLYPDSPVLPAVIGYEVAGEIDALGQGVDFPLGRRRVLALMPRFGGYSDCVCLPAEEALPIPDDLDYVKAAAIPVNYMSAWLMLIEMAHIEPGNKVLIHSVAGGVGQAAFQICQWMGAEVIGTASTWKHERLNSLGLEFCIDSQTQNFEQEVRRITNGRGVDVVLDPIGGRSTQQSYQCLAPLGRLVSFGVSAMVARGRRNPIKILREWWGMPRFHPLQLIGDSKGVFGVTLGCLKSDVSFRRKMGESLLKLFGEGVLDPVVDQTFPFHQTGVAHRRLQDRQNFGKLLLVPK